MIELGVKPSPILKSKAVLFNILYISFIDNFLKVEQIISDYSYRSQYLKIHLGRRV